MKEVQTVISSIRKENGIESSSGAELIVDPPPAVGHARVPAPSTESELSVSLQDFSDVMGDGGPATDDQVSHDPVLVL